MKNNACEKFQLAFLSLDDPSAWQHTLPAEHLAHVTGCEACRDFVSFYTSTMQADFDASQEPWGASPDWTEIRAAHHARHTKHGLRMWIPVAAAASVALLVGVLFFREVPQGQAPGQQTGDSLAAVTLPVVEEVVSIAQTEENWLDSENLAFQWDVTDRSLENQLAQIRSANQWNLDVFDPIAMEEL